MCSPRTDLRQESNACRGAGTLAQGVGPNKAAGRCLRNHVRSQAVEQPREAAKVVDGDTSSVGSSSQPPRHLVLSHPSPHFQRHITSWLVEPGCLTGSPVTCRIQLSYLIHPLIFSVISPRKPAGSRQDAVPRWFCLQPPTTADTSRHTRCSMSICANFEHPVPRRPVHIMRGLAGDATYVQASSGCVHRASIPVGTRNVCGTSPCSP